ncbi:MAG: tRNA lysidine(34) synthetase TilS [Clostridiales bacterium]|nr:tRNA lysidine(34) synthetase TilS [Clostridiales bacterium]
MRLFNIRFFRKSADFDDTLKIIFYFLELYIIGIALKVLILCDWIDFVLDKVIKTIDKFNMIKKNDSVIVGVSGGADSICLLHILNRISDIYEIKVTAVHINHCIRGKDADYDELFVKKICEDMGVGFLSFSKDIKKEAKGLSVSLEEAGRLFRYKCFDEVCKKTKNGKIAVAHNKNDNAETIFMRFIRGTGIKGLCGIPYLRGNIIRPLLNCERFEIESYCKENNLDFRIDSTNNVNIYTRNKVRLELIPWISENMNANIISTVVSNGAIISEEEKFLEEVSMEAFLKCAVNRNFEKEAVLDIERFSEFNDVIKRRVVRISCRFFSRDLHDISYAHVNMVIELSKKETGKVLPLPSGILAEKEYNCLKISKASRNNTVYLKEAEPFNYELTYDERARIIETGDTVVMSKNEYIAFSERKPYFSLQIDESKVKGKIIVRRRLNGDRIFINKVGDKKLKNIFSEKKISERQRGAIPLVCDGENVICAVGVRCSDLYIPDKFTKEKINIYFWRTEAL